MEPAMKVVVIDDEADICSLVKEGLEQTGRFVVVTATDPFDGERKCKEEKPNVILLDVVMPKKKGQDVVEFLKKDPETKNIPIVIMSGLGEMVYFKQKNQWRWLPNRLIVQQRGDVAQKILPTRAAEAYGVEGYLGKPFNTTSLIEALETTLKIKKPKPRI